MTDSSRFGQPTRDIHALLGEARQIYVQGRKVQAETLLLNVLEHNPKEIQALLALGIISTETGRTADAKIHLSKALAINPRYSPALCWMSFACLQTSDVSEAKRYAEQAVTATPQSPVALSALARALVHEGTPAKAIPYFQQAVELDKNNPALLNEFGEVLLAARLWFHAGEILKRMMQLSPDAKALYSLAFCEFQLGRMSDARRICLSALRMEPKFGNLHALMAQILTSEHKVQEAEPYWQKAIELDKNPALVQLQKGICLSAAGEFDDAVKELKNSIENEPRQGQAYQALTYAKRIGINDLALVKKIEGLLDDESLSDDHRMNLFYSLGKSCDDLGDYQRAMNCFDSANALRVKCRGPLQFNRKALAALVDAKIGLFSKQLISKWRTVGSESSLPILIIGMMRSGTTLVEQMLSRHPIVGGAGEQNYWSETEAATVDYSRGTINPGRMKACAQEYVQLLSSIQPRFQHVIDKNPANLQAVGSLHLALPNAKIILVSRNPIDTALSMWMTPIESTAEFLGDRSNIVFASKEFLRLADHWRRVLPADSLLDVRYENLVAQPKIQVQRILAFCGLEWNEACLHPELNETRVNTPSVWQARQPIYRTSTERWKKYEPWLGEFEELRGSDPEFNLTNS